MKKGTKHRRKVCRSRHRSVLTRQQPPEIQFAKRRAIRVNPSSPLQLPPVKHPRIPVHSHIVTHSAAICFQPLPTLATGGMPSLSRQGLGKEGSTPVTTPFVPNRARSWRGCRTAALRAAATSYCRKCGKRSTARRKPNGCGPQARGPSKETKINEAA